jgi:hypothetical protein
VAAERPGGVADDKLDLVFDELRHVPCTVDDIRLVDPDNDVSK